MSRDEMADDVVISISRYKRAIIQDVPNITSWKKCPSRFPSPIASHELSKLDLWYKRVGKRFCISVDYILNLR